jgi:hypothetical protein
MPGPTEVLLILMALVLGAGVVAGLVMLVLSLTNRRRPGRSLPKRPEK